MNFFKRIATILHLRHKWIAVRGNTLKITLHKGCGVPNYRKYKLVEGRYTKKSYYEGRPDENSYIEFEVFKPKTLETKILVWYTFNNKTKRYLVILKQHYKDKVNIS